MTTQVDSSTATGSTPGWSELLDAYEEALAGVQAALASGEWPQDGWTAPSLAVPGDVPTDGELARYRRLSVVADDVMAHLRGAMTDVQSELGQGRRHRQAARSYAHAAVIEERQARQG